MTAQTIRRRNKTLIMLTVLCALSLLAFVATADDKKPPAPGSPQFVAHVLDRIDDMYRGQQSQGTMEMNIKTKHWTRSIKMESWAMGKDYSLVRILKPLGVKVSRLAHGVAVGTEIEYADRVSLMRALENRREL